MQKELGMKHLYRIGIFAATCAVIGCLVFYLYGRFKEQVKDMGDYPQIYADKEDMEYHQQLEEQEQAQGPDAAEVDTQQRQFVSRRTVYVLEKYDSYHHALTVEQCEIPRQYLGMTREELEAELAVYAKSPSLEDVAQGLVSVGKASIFLALYPCDVGEAGL